MRRMMSRQEVVEIYKNMIENSNILANGQQYLEQIIEQASNFCTVSVSLISDPQIEIKTRNYISSIIKNILSHNWESNQFIIQEKNAIRQECVAGVQKSLDNPAIQQNLGDLISSFMVKDGIEDWKEPFNLLIQMTLSEKTLDFYCLIYSKVDDRINQTVPTLLSILLPLLISSESVVSRQKCLILYYLALQSFSFAEGADDDLVSECLDKTYNDYINVFFQIIQADQSNFYPNQLLVLKIFNLLFKDFPNYTEMTFKTNVQLLLKYLRKIIDINYEINLRPNKLLNVSISELELNQIEELFEKYPSKDTDTIDYENIIELFINECLNFIDVFMNYGYAESIHHLLAFPFVNIISNLILVPKQQETLIIEDPNLFVASEKADHDEEISNIRQKAIKSIENIIENESCQQATISSIIAISESMFCNRSEQPLKLIFQELQQPNNIMKIISVIDGFDQNSYNEFLYYSSLPIEKELYEWKGKELSLFLLGNFQNQITTFYQQNGGCTFQFIGNLIQEFSIKFIENSQNELLMCRYYQCFNSFAHQICLVPDHVEIIKKSLILSFTIDGGSQALKIIALSCLGQLCKQEINNNKQINSILNIDDNSAKNVVQSIIQVITKCSKDILPQILTNLLPIFSLLSNVAVLFTQNAVNIITQLITHFEGEADIQKKVIDILAVLAKEPSSYALLYHSFEQSINLCFAALQNFVRSSEEFNKIKQQDINVIQNRIQILKVLIQYKPSEIPIFNDCLSILLKLLYINDDISLQQEATLCLKQVIISQPSSLMENKNDLQQLYLKLIESISTQPEAFSQYLPNLIFVSYHNFLEINKEIAEKILEKLSECDSYFIIISFLIFFTRLLERNPKETLQFLLNYRIQSGNNQSGFEVIFNKLHDNFWYIRKDIIKNSLYLPLAKLLTIEEHLLSQFKFGDVETEASFQLFCLLSRTLEIEIFPEQFDNHQDTDNLQSYQEFQSYLISDIYYLSDLRLQTPTKQILTEFFQTMYTSESSKGVFEKFTSQMDFDEKLAIENVINQLQNN